MTSIVAPTSFEHTHLRPLNIFRDLPAVADLIDVCFSQTMDADGKQYVRDMRRAGSDNSFMQWANRAAESTSLPLTGYVWEEDGKIIGNASLIPFRKNKQKIYLIANIGTHPEYRRRGIARSLTQRAMQHARDKNVDSIWLHVRDDNPGAIELYKKLGFVERAIRSTWQATTDANAPTLQTDFSITYRHSRHWQTQLNWLNRIYPDYLAWHRPWSISTLRPGFWNWLYMLFIDLNARQWTAIRGDQLEATLSWIPYGRGESLIAGTGERSSPEALAALLIHARRELFHYYNRVALEFPSGHFDYAIEKAGFKLLRTLIWMQAT
jgi:GNAT superfamily N-acetyltransferase